ncbi:MAG: DUF192 domain-containing protein [Verrucomicrobia bacterium]|nr:DUF192 domain-containing protein [Verrucomicrobiota bacterium]
MTNRWLHILLVIGFCIGLGASCQKAASPVPTPRPAAPDHPYLDHAQPKLQTVKLWLGAQELVTEGATTMTEISTGMMFRKEMAENEAMIFVFGVPHRAAFYMRNTTLPLSCAYIDSEGVILEIHDMKPLDETAITAVSENVRYVLEVNQGWFERNKVAVGTVVRSEFGSLQQTFFRRN